MTTPPEGSAITERLSHIGGRLERIEDKLDKALDRTTRAEADIQWVKGHLRFSLSIAIAVIGGLATAIFKYMIPNQ